MGAISHKVTLGRLLATMATVLVAACGNPTAHSTTSPRASGSAAPAPNFRYLNPALFPEQDMPFSQASAQLKAVWTPYDVTVIPSRHVLDNMPAPPKVINATQGRLSDADAERLAWAEYRENAFIGWMEANIQPGFNDHLRVHGLFVGLIGNAVIAGHAVTNPACDLYANDIAVVPVDASIRQFETAKGYTVSSQFALIERYGQQTGCTTTETTGNTASPLFTYESFVGIETGTVKNDDVLGTTFFAESGRNCSGGPSDPAACMAI